MSKLTKTQLYTWRQAKSAMTRKYKNFQGTFYFIPRHMHHKQWICDRILESEGLITTKGREVED